MNRAPNRLLIGWLLASLYALSQTVPTPPPGKLTILYPFVSVSATGARPDGALLLGMDGNFYGTTVLGGCCGTIFRVTPTGNLTTIHSFTGGVGGGSTPRGAMTRDNEGNLYGTTEGSTGLNPTAFKITPAGAFTSFGNIPGNRPNGLVFARDGNLYGVTSSGGPGQNGVFFRLTTAGELTTLHIFRGDRENIDVAPAALIQGSDGAFYGASRFAILKITTEGTVSVVYRPQRVPNGPTNVWDGLNAPASGLVEAGDGNFYGSADDGVFRVTPGGEFKRLFRYAEVGLSGDSNFSVIHNNKTALVVGGDGNLYGSNAPSGAIYQVTTGGAYKLIYSFARDGSEGSVPSMLTVGPNGLYGTTSMLGPGKPLGGGTVFRVDYAGAGRDPTPPPPPPVSSAVPGKIEFIDPNVAPDPEIIDDPRPNLRGMLLGTVPWAQSSYQVLADYPRLAQGLAADGVTPLIIRCQIPAEEGAKGTPVTFTIGDETGQNATTEQVGTLGCLYGESCANAGGTSYTVQPQLLANNQYAAFVRLTAPVDFVREGSDDAKLRERLISVSASFPQAPGGPPRKNDTFVILARPPVVLLHGIWSSKDTWGWNCILLVNVEGDCLQDDSRFTVWAQDYKETNADYFATNLGLEPLKGKNQPREGISAATEILRGKGIAATQADFVGHSMGGLLGRLYIGEYTRSPIQEFPALDLQVHYRRDDNFRAGDIHKIITLNTPHSGSEMTRELLDPQGVKTNLGSVVDNVACVNCGAVSDLTPGSPPLSQLPAIQVPSHAIYGIGGNRAIAELKMEADTTVLISLFKGKASPWGVLFFAMTEYADSELSCLFGALRHDTIVNVVSQIGGLPASATTGFDAQPSFSTPFWWAIHNTVTQESRVSRRVIELLNASVRSELFGQFPAGSGTSGVGAPCHVP